MKKVTTNIKKFKKADTGTNIPGESQIKGYNPNSQQTMDDVQSGYNAMKSDTNLVNDPLAQQQMKSNQGLPAVSPNTIDTFKSVNNSDTDATGQKNSTKLKVKMGGLNSKGGINTSELFMGSLGLISSLLPNTPVGSNINPLQDAYNPYPNGTGSQAIADSGIHIKPSHKGRFTAYKERTGKTTEEALHSKDPHVRQMANFARNAKKWKHEDGGKIEYMMGGSIGMSGQMATMTNNIGSASPSKLSKKKATDGQSLSDQEKDNWNAFHNNLAYNNPNYGTGVLNHNTASETSIQDWNTANPGRAITRPIADYQHVFTTTPLGRSKVDNYGTNPKQEIGQLTGASSFHSHQYYNDKGQLLHSGYDPISRNDFNNLTTNSNWESNNKGIPMPESTPNNYTPISTPGVTRPQQDNWHTNEDTNYNMHGGSSESAAYGNKITMANNGVQVEDNQYKMLSPNTAELGGEYHTNGGTDVQYGNQTVEGQKGEPMAIGNDGSLNLFGKMYIPGTSTKFDAAAKTIAKDEVKVAKSNKYSNDLVQNADPTNKYQALTFNSGKVMLDGNAQKAKELNSQKEILANIQDTMHRVADNMGVEPKDISTELKAKYGVSLNKMKAANGAVLAQQKQMMSEHPDWVDEALQKYGKPKTGKFDDGLTGPRTDFVKNYVAQKSNPINFANNNGADSTDPNLANPNVISPLPLANLRQVPAPGQSTEPLQFNRDLTPIPVSPEQDTFNPIPANRMPTTPPVGSNPNIFKPYKNKLGVWDILPEAMTALEQVEPVPGHTINSYLQNPYNVSFQDRRNDNMSIFNTAAKTQTGNPATIGALAGQEYVANNNVNADEFRTNQGIYNSITNENYKTMNSDKEMQLKLNMDQEQKQAQALAYTKRDKFNALSSLADKKGTMDRANFTDSMYANMYHSQGVDANGKPLHQYTGVITDPYVALQDNNEDEKRRTEILKRFGYDQKGRKVSETTDRSYTTSKFGKKITKIPPKTYANC